VIVLCCLTFLFCHAQIFLDQIPALVDLTIKEKLFLLYHLHVEYIRFQLIKGKLVVQNLQQMGEFECVGFSSSYLC